MCEHDEPWKELCRQAAIEQDPTRLSTLIHEINEILSARNRPRGEAPKAKSEAA
jgi:hypothetical protein